MQKISVDLIRLAVSGAVIGAVALAANLAILHNRDRLVIAEFRIPTPIHVQAISVAAPAMCLATTEPIAALGIQETPPERRTILQSCASAAPIWRRHSEPGRELPSLLALAP